MAYKPRKLYPLPVQGLFDDPDVRALSSASLGMLFRLCEHFWLTHCRPLPRDDDQLFAIARAHRPTWRHHRVEILRIFERVRPEMERYFTQRENNAASIMIIRSKGGKTTSALRKAAAFQKPVTPPLPVFATGAIPHRSPEMQKASEKVTRTVNTAQRPRMLQGAGR